MKFYKKVNEIRETEVLDKCLCDKCGEECKITNGKFRNEKRTVLEIRPRYVDTEDFVYLDLCHKCTKELLNWFPQTEDVKELKDSMDYWNK